MSKRSSVQHDAPARDPRPDHITWPLWARFGAHLLINFVMGGLIANFFWLMPFTARQQFDASAFETTLLTMSVPTCGLLSIFWDSIFRGSRTVTYLGLFWLIWSVPYALIGFSDSLWQMLVLQWVASVGFAAWPPLSGALARWLYPNHLRGRLYSGIHLFGIIAGGMASLTLGQFLDAGDDSWRHLQLYLGAAAMAHAVIVSAVWYVAVSNRPPREANSDTTGGVSGRLRKLLNPIVHAGVILAADRRFLRYEIAFMTYGAAFMICDALLPIYATERLALDYASYAKTAQAVKHWGMALFTLPMGFILDRYGPMRTSGLAFGILAGYPLLMMLTYEPVGLEIATWVFGAALGGITMGWTLGPVMLAKRAEQASQYLAIHAALVGLRGIIFQLFGVALYRWTNTFEVPLIVALVLSVWAAYQMFALAKDVSRQSDEDAPQSPSDPQQRSEEAESAKAAAPASGKAD